MKLAVIGLGLILLGLILAVAMEGFLAEAVIVAGFAVALFKMIGVADAEGADRQAEIDARADEIRSRHQNPV
jgi:hypothetical protein